MKIKFLIVAALLLFPLNVFAAAGQGITTWSPLVGSLADNDYLAGTDVSDTAQSTSGSSRKITLAQLRSYLDASYVLKNAAITGATKAKITYDAKGLVTYGADLADTDIPALSIAKTTGLQGALDGKQPTLVSGTTIKTINSTSLLGSGDIVISGGASVSDAVYGGDWDTEPNRLVAPSKKTLFTKINAMDSSISGKEAAGVAAGLDTDHTNAFNHGNIHASGSDNQTAATVIYDGTETVEQILDKTISGGILDAPVVTDAGGLNITWGTGKLWDHTSKTVINTLSGSGTCVNNATNYLKWVNGTTLVIGPTRTTDNEVLIATITSQNGDIWNIHLNDAVSKIQTNIKRGLEDLAPVLVSSGLLVSGDPDATNIWDVSLSAGTYYKDVYDKHTQATQINSRTTPMYRWYQDGTGGWTYTTSAQIDPTQYNTGTGLAATSTGKYYKSMFVYGADAIHWFYPQVEYGTIAQAMAGALPATPVVADIYPKSTAVIIKHGAAALPTAGGEQWIDVRPVLGASAGAGNISDHGSLTGLADDDHTQYALESSLGTAATTAATDYATAAQGSLASSALQSEVDPTVAGAISSHAGAADPHTGYALESALGTAAYTPTTDYATAAQGATADSALQPTEGTITGTWLQNASYPGGGVQGISVGSSASPSTSNMPPLWIEKWAGATDDFWDRGAIYGGVFKQSGDNYTIGITGYVAHNGGTGQTIGVHGRSLGFHANAATFGGWFWADAVSTTAKQNQAVGLESNVANRFNTPMHYTEVSTGGKTVAIQAVSADGGGTSYEATAALFIGKERAAAGSFASGIIVDTNALSPYDGQNEAIWFRGASTGTGAGGILFNGNHQYGIDMSAATLTGPAFSMADNHVLQGGVGKIKYNGTAWQYSNNGTDYSDIGAGGSGATQLSELSDVNTSTPTNRNVLVADGVDFESRALVEADISNLTHTTDAGALTSGNLAVARMPVGGNWPITSNVNIQNAGASVITLGTSGAINTGKGAGDASIGIGALGSGDRNAYFTLISDGTYTTYGDRFIRLGLTEGVNAKTSWQHRGTGSLLFQTVDAADVELMTTNTLRLEIDSGGDILWPNETTPLGKITGTTGAISAPSVTTLAANTDLTLSGNGTGKVVVSTPVDLQGALTVDAADTITDDASASTTWGQTIAKANGNEISITSTTQGTGNINLDGVSAADYNYSNGASAATYTPVFTSLPASGKVRYVTATFGGGAGVDTMTWTNCTWIGTAGAAATITNKKSTYAFLIRSTGAMCRVVEEGY